MPQRKSARSLQSTCLCFITKNINHWSSHYEEYYLGQAHYLHVLGPFNELNSQLAEDLMTVLVRERRISRSSLQLLLYGRALRNLDLSSCSRIVNDEVILIIASNCKILQKLDLSNCERVTSTGFNAIGANLPRLSSLYLTGTKLRSSAAQVIFNRCRDLQDLSLEYCRVGDQDLMVLCRVASSGLGTKLKRLNISCTMATETGVRAILREIPQIQLVDYPGLLRCLFQDDPASRQTGTETYKLRSVQCWNATFVSNEMLRAIPDVCPKLTQLDLRFASGVDNAGLRQLARLHRLQDLQLYCEKSKDITFGGGILPILEEIGANISILSLQDMKGLDPVAVYELCPNLKKLVLLMMKENFSTDAEIPLHSKGPMTALTELEFWCRNGDNTLTAEALGFVLSNSVAVESLLMIQVDSFTDSLLEGTLSKNRFNRLKKLSLHECHRVTENALSDLIQSDTNQLQNVKLINCYQITRVNYEMWERWAKRENFEVAIEWE